MNLVLNISEENVNDMINSKEKVFLWIVYQYYLLQRIKDKQKKDEIFKDLACIIDYDTCNHVNI